MSNASEQAWWHSFYNDTMADMFLVRADSKELAATCAFLTEQLHISPGATVFDQCCGVGSLSLPMAAAGAQVIGVDQAATYIERARRAAVAQRTAAQYVCGDAFDFIPSRPCDAAFNWASGFGCADDDQQNLKMLQRAFQSLKGGGRFILDFQNIPGVLRGFRQSIVRRHAAPEGEILLVRESHVDLPAGRLRQQWTYVLPDGRRITEHSSLRLYLPDMMIRMLSTCGFTDIATFGDVRGEKLTMDSPRCICLGTKP